ncbi:MAG: hypothetical protein R2864_08320 [Syntrophotaleaceae bacterium]
MPSAPAARSCRKEEPRCTELVRGKTGRVYGNLMSLLTVMKALPLAYNKDMQEDKEPLFDTIDTVKGSLKVFADMIDQLTDASGKHARSRSAELLHRYRRGRLRGAQGILPRCPWRSSARRCATASSRTKGIPELSLDEFRSFSDHIEADIYDYVTLDASVNARRATGGTAREAVQREIARSSPRTGRKGLMP